MKKNDYLYRVADLYCAHGERLLALGIGDGMAPAGEREQIAKIKREIDSYNWSGGTESLEEFEAGFNKFLTICEYLAMVPSPYGNPFSIGLVGEDLAKGDYTSAGMHLLGGIPWLGLLKRGSLLLKGAKYVHDLLRVCPAVLKPGLKVVLLWIANSMTNITHAKVAAYGTVMASSALLEKLSNETLVGAARRVSSGGFTSSFIKKPVEDKNFNSADAAMYLSDYLMRQTASQIAGIAAEVRSAVS